MNRGEIHRLTQEVKNPKPDRRTLKTTVWARETWPAGSLWRVVPRDETTVEILYMRGTHGQICANDVQYESIRPHLQPLEMLATASGVDIPSRDTFRAFFMLAENDAKAILAHLWFTGRVTLEELGAVNEALRTLDEDEYEKFYW